jgi:hypothetical protein
LLCLGDFSRSRPVVKGILSRDSVSTETICVQLRPKQCFAFPIDTCKVVHLKYMTLRSNRGPLDVKWKGLDSTLLLKKMVVLLIAKVRSPNLREDCHKLEAPAGSESGGWQSAVQLKADCQAVIIVVANRGIGAR